MITTITTTTTTVVILQQAAAVAGIGVVALIVSLAANELLNSREGIRRFSSLARRLKIAIFPLLFAFALVLTLKIWEVL